MSQSDGICILGQLRCTFDALNQCLYNIFLRCVRNQLEVKLFTFLSAICLCENNRSIANPENPPLKKQTNKITKTPKNKFKQNICWKMYIKIVFILSTNKVYRSRLVCVSVPLSVRPSVRMTMQSYPDIFLLEKNGKSYCK